MNDYESDIIDLINSHHSIKGKYKLVQYIPELCYEVDTIIEGEQIAETFDVFRAVVVGTGETVCLSYSDYDNYRISSLKTVQKYVKLCSL